MNPTVILYPVLVEVLLTFVLLVAMGPARSRSLRDSGKTLDDLDVRLGHAAYSEEATKVARSYANQFELPVLFYAVVAFALITRGVDVFMVALAWVFAVSRVVHAWIHTGPNIIKWRASVFIIGAVALAAMWIALAIHIL
jgi:hypothetical protein